MKKIEYLILCLIILLGLTVRLYKINTPLADWHSWRQVDTASVSRIFVDSKINFLYPRYHDISWAQTGKNNPEGYRFVEFPIFNAIHALAFKYVSFLSINNLFEVVGRMITIISSLFSLVFLYLIGKRFISQIGGFLVAFFYATLPFNIFFTRTILPESLAISLGLAGMYFFTSHIDTKKNTRLILSSIFLAMSILVKPFTIFYTIPLVFLLFQSEKGAFIKHKKYWIFAFVILAPFILWRFWIMQFPEGIPHTKWAFNGDGIRFRPAFWRWIMGERLGRLILGIWGLIPFSLGLISITKKNSFIHVYLLSMFVFVSVFATANVRHDYYQAIIVPSICLILGLGVYTFWTQQKFNKVMVRFLIVFSVVMMFGMGWYQAKEMYKINNPSIISAGMKVRELTDKDSKVIAPYNKDTAFLYQTGRVGWPFLQEEIEKMVENGADYYVSVTYDPDTLDIMRKYNVVYQSEDFVIVKLSK